MTKPVETLHMPAGLPYPQSPAYSTGQYGVWGLHEKPEPTFMRGYFTGFDTEPAGYYLEREGDVWMSDSRLERESHAVHLLNATGTVVVCGVGMGLYLFNIAAKASVKHIIAVDRERQIMDLVQHATDFDSWKGKRKIEFVQKDALRLTSADLGFARIDYLYVDIWPELGDPEALSQTQAIQEVVKARNVGWWGQEVDFMQWLFEHRPAGHVPVAEDLRDFNRALELPAQEQPESYLMGCGQAGIVYSTYGSLPFATAAREGRPAE